LSILINKFFSAYFGHYYKKVHQNGKKVDTYRKIFNVILMYKIINLEFIFKKLGIERNGKTFFFSFH